MNTYPISLPYYLCRIATYLVSMYFFFALVFLVVEKLLNLDYVNEIVAYGQPYHGISDNTCFKMPSD